MSDFESDDDFSDFDDNPRPVSKKYMLDMIENSLFYFAEILKMNGLNATLVKGEAKIRVETDGRLKVLELCEIWSKLNEFFEKFHREEPGWRKLVFLTNVNITGDKPFFDITTPGANPYTVMTMEVAEFIRFAINDLNHFTVKNRDLLSGENREIKNVVASIKTQIYKL